MEVYKCLDDIICILETDNNILKAKDCVDRLVLIDSVKLKNNPRLEGADVFKMLFGLSDNSPYGDFGIEIDNKGYLTILSELNICAKDWYLLIFFLEKGKVPHYDTYLKTGRYETSVYNNLEIVMEISIKLGGIPSFDLFYDNFNNNIIDDIEKKIQDKSKGFDVNNPSEPKEDEKKIYQWACCSFYHPIDQVNFEENHKAGYGWSFTKQRQASIQGRNLIQAFYRREWSWTEYDEGESEEEDEEDEEDEEENNGQSSIYQATEELPPWDQPQAI